MKTAIFGGSFDPVHVGHLIAAAEVLFRTEYERVLFVPASYSPFRGRSPFASGTDRVRMLELAISGSPGFAVSRHELQSERVSYTVDTVRTLIASGGVSERPGLVIGDDLVEGFDRWKEASSLRELVEVVVVSRDAIESPGFRVLDNTPIPVSSSEIRRRFSIGAPVRFLVPDAVLQYIEENRLYRPGTGDGDVG